MLKTVRPMFNIHGERRAYSGLYHNVQPDHSPSIYWQTIGTYWPYGREVSTNKTSSITINSSNLILTDSSYDINTHMQMETTANINWLLMWFWQTDKEKKLNKKYWLKSHEAKGTQTFYVHVSVLKCKDVSMCTDISRLPNCAPGPRS